jgi:hypothetical protein
LLPGISSPSPDGLAWCDPAYDSDGLKHILGVPRWGRHADNELASGREQHASRGEVEAADLVIAQPVLHESQQPASDGDAGLCFPRRAVRAW